MELTLAIPAHNDHQDLCHLLRDAAGLHCVQHIVVVDDGSDIPITTDSLLAASGLHADQLTLLRHDTARGAGAARNRALEAVPTEHVLFLDADDLPTRELPHLLADLDGRFFDFCIFQHHDTRMERRGDHGQMPHDQAHWHRAGTEVGALTPVSKYAAAHLCRTANYPWNKIYRTAFLRDNGIRCSEISVHNDIELHWRSFISSTRILASDRIVVIHEVHEHGNRLTNRTGPERLEVIGPLEQIATLIQTDTDQSTPYALPFFSFVIGLFDWIPSRLDPALHPQFAGLVQSFLRDHVSAEIMNDITRTDPDLIARVLSRLPDSDHPRHHDTDPLPDPGPELEPELEP